MEPTDNQSIDAVEIITVLAALVVLLISAVVFALVLRRLAADRPQAEPPITPERIESAQVFPTATLQPPTPTPDPLALTPEGSQAVEHVVQPGENAASIAALYGVELFALLEANNLTQDSIIQAEQVLTIPKVEGVVHEVRFGETLSTIAALYGVPVGVVEAANNITDPDAVITGQRLRIPGVDSLPNQPTATPPPPPAEVEGPILADWPRSTLIGDLVANYPLLYEHPRFNVHYQPGTYPDAHLDEVVFSLEEALIRVENTLDVRMTERFDIYLAGTLFEEPNAHLRGLSGRSLNLFLLVDGSGDEGDNAYLYTHEMTHMVSRNTWGTPSTTMLSEGLATYVGQEALEEAGYLPYEQLCLAAYDAGVMPSMAAIERDWQQFQGHIRDRYSYFGSGCFVGWLIDEIGLEAMARLYPTSDYVNTSGRSLSQLNADWLADLDDSLADLEADPEMMVAYTEEVQQAYAYVFSVYDGNATMHRAYRAVDQARLALWRGDYEDARLWLDQVYALTGFQPG